MRSGRPRERNKLSVVASMERRAWVRYASTLEASCQDSGVLRNAGWPGKVLDVSLGGIGLILRHRFPPGAPLTVELKSRDGKSLQTISVRVMHSRPVIVEGHPCWLVGCALVRNFTEHEIQEILTETDANPNPTPLL